MIKPLLVWKNPDSTRDLNAVWAPMSKGVYDGGTLTLSASNLTVTVAPFIAKSRDGMTVVSDNPEVVTLTPGTTQYLVLFAQYGIPSPTVQLVLVSDTTWNTSIHKDYYVTFAKFVTPALATAATSATVRYEQAEYTEKLGQSPWRASVATFASLPTVGNRNGDARITLDTMSVYLWNEAIQIWEELTATTDLMATTSRIPLEGMVERLALNTSGLIGNVLDSQYSHDSIPTFSGLGLTVTEQGVANQIGLGALHAYVHGHFIKRHAGVTTLAAAPGVGSRYDLMFLEVWQETVTSADISYENDTLGMDTFSQVLAHFNQVLENNLSPNQTIESVDFIDSATIVVTKSTIRVTSNVSSGTVGDPSVGMTASVNQFGNPYTQNANSDRFAYTALAAGVHSTRTWAIPLLVLKRVSTEATFKVFDATTNVRYAFDVAPRATLGKALTELYSTEFQASAELENVSSTKPSGWLNGPDLQFGGTVPVGVVRVPTANIRIQGRELLYNQTDVTLPAAPAAGSERNLVYVEFYCSPASPISTMGGGGIHSYIIPNVGLRQYIWWSRTVATSVGAALDEADGMAALGFTQGAGALWTRAATADENTKDGQVYAMAIAVVHRRNSGAWSLGANPNGSTGRPDGAAYANPSAIHPRELVDLRRKIVTADKIPGIIENSFSKLRDGTLKSRLRVNPFASDCAGTSLLMSTVTSAVPVVGKHTMTPVPSAANAHSVWSDSDELIPMSFTLNSLQLLNPTASSDGVFSWDGGGINGSLAIVAPAGMHLLKTGVSVITGPYSYADTVTNLTSDPAYVANFAFCVGSNRVDNAPLATPNALSTSGIVTDSNGNVTSVTVTSPVHWYDDGTYNPGVIAAKMIFTVWFVKPNRDTAAAYSANGSLLGAATSVYSITHGGAPINSGAITARITKTVTGATFSVTQADVFAARPDIASAAAAVRLYGVAAIRVVSTTGGSALRYVKLNNGGGAPGYTNMDVELVSALPPNTPVEITVMCDGDLIYQWASVLPGSRGVRGLYSYAVVATSSHLAALTNSGYTGVWTNRTGTVPQTQRGASLSDCLGVAGGVRAGISGLSNSQADHVDYVLSVRTGTDHTFIYQDSDAGGFGLNQFVPATTCTADTLTNGGVLPNHSPYTAWAFVGMDSAGPTLSFVGIVENAPTSALEVVYEMPVYEGMATSADLKARLRGDLVYTGSAHVTTEGTNTSLLHPAIANTAFPQVGGGLDGASDFKNAAAGMYKDPDYLPSDTGFRYSTGSAVRDARKHVRDARAAWIRNVPYPSPYGTASAKRYAPRTTLRSSVLADRNVTRTKVITIPGTSIGSAQSTGYSGSNTPRVTGAEYQPPTDIAYPLELDTRILQLPLPVGAVLRSVRICWYVSLIPINTCYAHLHAVRLDSAQSTLVEPLLVGTVSRSGFGGRVVDSVAPVGGNSTGYDAQVMGNTTYYLSVQTPTNLLGFVRVLYVEVEYTETSFSVAGSTVIPTALTSPLLFTDTGLDTWSDAVASIGTSTDMVLPADYSAKTVDVPSTWTAGDDTTMEAAYIVDGATDFVGDWVRGRTCRAANADVTYYEAGWFGYVPLTGTELQSQPNVPVASVSLDLPPAAPKREVVVNTAASDTSLDMISVATVTPYAMVNSRGDLTLGVSTGVHENTLNPVAPSTGLSGYSNVHKVQVGGSTIDAFWPAGRPLVEPR